MCYGEMHRIDKSNRSVTREQGARKGGGTGWTNGGGADCVCVWGGKVVSE